jgi:NAD(P)-dependent dehydrogenase (short-subunit alcohol dehydrogenase family)
MEAGMQLKGQVALVAGATRGAGRGIAAMLGAAGATVYCTGRTTRGSPSPMARPETIEETAELVSRAGGVGVAVRVDHTQEAEVAALVARIEAEQGRLDVLVNDVWGGDPLTSWGDKFWSLDLPVVRTLLDQAIFSHLITARHAAPLMIARGRGLIVEVGDGQGLGYRGQLAYDMVKTSVIRLAYAMAWDLLDTGVTALAITPGFLRSEVVLESFGVTEANWQDAAPRDLLFGESETPSYIGRAIVALAGDAKVGRWAGMALPVGDLAQAYGFDDIDGRRPMIDRKFEEAAVGLLEAPGELDANGRFFLTVCYMRDHRDPKKAAWCRRLAERLGLKGLGQGLAIAG